MNAKIDQFATNQNFQRKMCLVTYVNKYSVKFICVAIKGVNLKLKSMTVTFLNVLRNKTNQIQ